MPYNLPSLTHPNSLLCSSFNEHRDICPECGGNVRDLTYAELDSIIEQWDDPQSTPMSGRVCTHCGAFEVVADF